ncbi:mechanosensitive ion channel family protein [Natronococcus occultus]|uniref:mechanosensitive ion channel family protein n=1 Tax=Natronococcus occultus TaxID=29288 RepID=UPI000677C26B|nr:mechanosensitive ion channel family protein [Natronococcus occultus]
MIATIVLLVAWYGSKLTARTSRPQIRKRIQRRSVAEVVLRLFRAVVLLFAGFAVLGIYGVDLSDLVLSATIISAVVGVILAPVASDVVGGFFILTNRPYEVGDMIELTDREESGHVIDVTLRYTKIRTLENTFLVVPNSTIRERDVVNLSADDVALAGLDPLPRHLRGGSRGGPGAARGRRRGDRRRRRGRARDRDGRNEVPRPAAGVYRGVRGPRRSTPAQLLGRTPLSVPTDALEIDEEVWDRLEDADVEIAYPHTHLVFDETSGTARVALDRGRDDARPETVLQDGDAEDDGEASVAD